LDTKKKKKKINKAFQPATCHLVIDEVRNGFMWASMPLYDCTALAGGLYAYQVARIWQGMCGTKWCVTFFKPV